MNIIALLGLVEPRDNDCTTCENWQICPIPALVIGALAHENVTGQTVAGIPVFDFDTMNDIVADAADRVDDPRLVNFLGRMIEEGKEQQPQLLAAVLQGTNRLN